MEWVVVFNPERPPFWIPLTVREVADASVGYFTLLQRTELDRMLVQQMRAEMVGLTPEDLAAPACLGHDSRTVLQVNGQAQGLALMRFNPAYWNRALPISAVQLVSYGRTAEPDTAGGAACPDYPHRLARTITQNTIATRIQRHQPTEAQS